MSWTAYFTSRSRRGGLPGRLDGDDFVTAAGSDEAAHPPVGVALEAERGLHLTVVVRLQQGTAEVAAIVHNEVAGAERGQMPECSPPLVAMGQQCEVARQATADLVQADEQSLRVVHLRPGRGVAFPHQSPGQVELESTAKSRSPIHSVERSESACRSTAAWMHRNTSAPTLARATHIDTWIGTFAEIGHGCKIGNDASVASGVETGRQSHVGDESVLESSAVVLVAAIIGERSRLDILTRTDRQAVTCANPLLGARMQVRQKARFDEGAQVGKQCYVGESARIGENVTLRDNVRLWHETTVGAETHPGSATICEPCSRLGGNVITKHRAILEPRAIVGDGAVTGAGSRTARDARVTPGAQVGTVRPVFGEPDQLPQAPDR